MKIWARIVHHKAETYWWEIIMAVAYTALSVATAYVFWWAATNTGANIPGWTLKDLVFFALLIDFAAYVDGILYYFQPTSGMIRRGELATILLKPAPMWMTLFPYRVGAEDIYATGMKAFFVFAIGLSIGYSPENILTSMCLAVLGAILENIIYATIMYTNFFVGDARPMVRAYDEIWGAAKEYPVDAYRKSFMYWILVFIVPLYFLGTLPMHYIMGQRDGYILLLPALIGLWFAVAKTMWHIGLKRWEAYGG